MHLPIFGHDAMTINSNLIMMNSQIIDLHNPIWTKTLQQLRHDVYHLPEYIAIESNRTKTIPEAFIINDGEKIFFVPYLLRRCDDIFNTISTTSTIWDIVSPYGYPGILLSQAAADTPGFPDFAINEFKKILNIKGVCSAFLRLHPILNHNFPQIFTPNTFRDTGETISIDLTLSEAEMWAHTRRGHQSTINKCKRSGFTARVVPLLEYIDEFIAIYEQTMNRVGATQSYYFPTDYFTSLSKLGDKTHLGIIEQEQEIICGSVVFECCSIVQAHLGGTKNSFLHQSPFIFLLDYIRRWGKERGNKVLHIGGGVGGCKDSLYTFKSGFSRQRHRFLTLRLITNSQIYQNLVELRAKELNMPCEHLLNSNFFPAYRQ